MRTYLFYVLVVLLGVTACEGRAQSNASGGEVKVLSVEAYKAKLSDASVQLIDVRTPQEFAQGHIAGAKNINVLDPKFANEAAQILSKDKPVALYCRTGNRSQRAVSILRDLGYKTIYDLKGGYLAWQ